MRLSVAVLLAICATLSSVTLAGELQAQSSNKVDEKLYGCGVSGVLFCGGGWGMPISSYSWLTPSVLDWCGGGFYGVGVFASTSVSWGWFKSVNSDVARRSLSLESAEATHENQLAARSDAITCKAHDGQLASFDRLDCRAAVDKLLKDRVWQASCGTCQMSLVNAKGHAAPHLVPSNVLEKVANSILNSCTSESKPSRRAIIQDANHLFSKRSPAESASAKTGAGQVALVLTKGAGAKC